MLNLISLSDDDEVATARSMEGTAISEFRVNDDDARSMERGDATAVYDLLYPA